MNDAFDHQILSRHRFALVDPSALAFLPEGMTALPVVPPEMPASAHLMPGLLDLHHLTPQAGEALLAMLYRSHQAQEAPVVALFIDTDISATEFIHYWNRLQIATPTLQQQFWLRLHDPRVLHQLKRILSPAQWKKLLGPVQGLTYWVGTQWLHAARQTGETAAAGDLGVAPWPWERVRMIGIINRALDGAGVVATGLLHDGAATVEKLVSVAAQFDLTEQADLVEFAVRGLSSSPSFHEHPEVAPAIRPSSEPDDDSRLSDRLALIDERIWLEISSPLQKTGH